MGHRLYVGEATRPNTLTWFITLNGASLSTDMAQRAVIIKLDKPKRSGVWSDETRQFIAEHRDHIIADIVGALRAAPADLDLSQFGSRPWAALCLAEGCRV